jgi:HD-like signal output (HDOD) protein
MTLESLSCSLLAKCVSPAGTNRPISRELGERSVSPKMRNELTAEEVQTLHKRLAHRLKGLTLPSLPYVANQVLRLVADPDASLRDYGAVIRADQALTAKLIRMANAPLFIQRNPVTTIERAMIVLGMARLKAAVLGFQLVSASDRDSLSRRLWSESVFRGWLSHAIVSAFDNRLAGEGFIIGLMLDAGLAMMPRLLGESYYDLVSPDLLPSKAFAIELSGLPFTHADVGAALAKLWNFPPALAQPIAWHHEMALPPDPHDPEQLLRAVAQYTGALDLWTPFQTGQFDIAHFLPGVAARLFRFDAGTMAGLIHQACQDYNATRELFGDSIDQRFDVDAMLNQANATLVAQIEQMLTHAGHGNAEPGATTLDVAGRRLILSLAGPGRIRTMVTDSSGRPLFIDEVLPLTQPAEEVRSILLLEDASDVEFHRVLGQLRMMAA